MQVETASKGKQRKAAQAELEKVEARLAKYQHRISTGQSGDGLPKVLALAKLCKSITKRPRLKSKTPQADSFHDVPVAG